MAFRSARAFMVPPYAFFLTARGSILRATPPKELGHGCHCRAGSPPGRTTVSHPYAHSCSRAAAASPARRSRGVPSAAAPRAAPSAPGTGPAPAAAAAPIRSSRTLGKRPSGGAHVLLEVVAQLLDRPELVRQPFAAAHAAAPVRVLHQIAVAQPIIRFAVEFQD